MVKVLHPALLPASMVVGQQARGARYARLAQIEVAVMLAALGSALSLSDVLVIHAMWGLVLVTGLAAVIFMWLAQITERDYGVAAQWQLEILAQICTRNPQVSAALAEVETQQRALTFKEAEALLKSEEKQ